MTIVNIEKFKMFLAVMLLMLSLICGATDIVKDGKSSYKIFLDKNEPSSVYLGAKELKEYIKKVTGCDIKIATKAPAAAYISLGYNKLAKDAGVNLSQVKADGYKIVVKNGNIYILGYDTKDNTISTKCSFSKGTLFGTYSFIEKYLGVRWFMPGKEGEYFTKKADLSIMDTDYVENPDFRWRSIPYLAKKAINRKIVSEWMLRQKINVQAYKHSLVHYHVWQRIFTDDVYKKHPEYFSKLNGKRMPPVGDRYKICTTNPGAIKLHADYIIKYFDKHPDVKGYSVSPTDSAGYCQCKKCRALDEKNADKNGRFTKRILHYYNAVAKLVYKRYPDKYVCGYIYADYLYPPQDKNIKLADNLFLVIASSLTYGYTYYRPEVQKKWNEIMRSWCSMTKNISYYDLPMHSSANNGAPLAPGIEQLKKMFLKLKHYKVKGLYIYGEPEWGHGVVYNYLLAKLMWKADFNVNKHLDDFYSKCYGAAGKEVKELFDLVDAGMKNYYLKHTASYTLTRDILAKVYAANADKMEKLYFAALKHEVEEKQKQRLKMLGENLKVMFYLCKAYGLIEKANASKLYLSEKEFNELATKFKDAFYLPVLNFSGDSLKRKIRMVSVSPAAKPVNAEKTSRFYLRGSVELVIQAQNENIIEVDFTSIRVRSEVISYLVVDSSGNKIVSGMVAKNKTVKFIGKTSEIYHMFVKTKSSSYCLRVKNAPYAFFAGKDKKYPKGLHFLGRVTPMYLYVPKTAREFTVTINSASNPESKTGGETALAKLYDSSGKLVENFSTVKITVDRKTIKNTKAGFWKLVISKAPVGYLDDVYVSLSGKHVSGYVSLEANKILKVSLD